MSPFAQLVLDTGNEALLAKLSGDLSYAHEVHERKRLLYLNATDEQLDELAQSAIEKCPRLQSNAASMRETFAKIRTRAQDKAAWHEQLEKDEW